MKKRSSIFLCLLIASSLSITQASIKSYHAIGEFTGSSFPTDIAQGDKFSIDFSYDDSVLDSNNNSFGNFAGALKSLDFKLLPGLSAGQYPGGYMTGYGEVETIDGVSYIPDRFYARADYGTFPSLGGFAFYDLLFVLDDPSHTTPITDTGGSPSLASVLNGDLVLSRFSQTTVRIDAVDKHGSVAGVVTSLTLVPEPSCVVLASVGVAVLLFLRFCKRLKMTLNSPNQCAGANCHSPAKLANASHSALSR